MTKVNLIKDGEIINTLDLKLNLISKNQAELPGGGIAQKEKRKWNYYVK